MSRIARTSAGWAFLAAIGAFYLVVAAGLVVLTPLLGWLVRVEELVNHLFSPPPPTGVGEAAIWGISAAAGAAIATAVARIANGPRAIALVTVFMLLAGAIRVSYAIYSRSEAIEGFTMVTIGNVPEATAVMFLPAMLAVALAWVVPVRPARSVGANPLLESAGAYALVANAAIPLVAFSVIGQWGVDLIGSPYWVVGAGPTLHAVIVLLQAFCAGAVYGLRTTGALSLRIVGVFACLGVAAVLPTDLMPILLTLFLDWTYTPLSLLLVPSTTAAVGALIATAFTRWHRGRALVATTARPD